MRTCVRACVRACVLAFVLAYICSCVRACIRAHANTHTRARTQTHTHTHTHAHTRTHTHTHAHTRTHAFTCAHDQITWTFSLWQSDSDTFCENDELRVTLSCPESRYPLYPLFVLNLDFQRLFNPLRQRYWHAFYKQQGLLIPSIYHWSAAYPFLYIIQSLPCLPSS